MLLWTKKRGLLNLRIPNLQVYIIKTPLIGRISIKTFFLGPKIRPIRGVPVSPNLNSKLFRNLCVF